MELNYFVFEKHINECTSNTDIHTLRLCVYTSSSFPFISLSNRFSRCLDDRFCSFRSLQYLNLFQSIMKHCSTAAKLFRISKTCHRAHKYHKYPYVSFACTLPIFIALSNRFSRWLNDCFCSFRSLFESILIDYKTLELNYFAFETFYLLPFFAYVSRPQLGPP